MNKCHPNNLQYETQSMVGKRLIYHDGRPLDEMLEPSFWTNVVHGRSSDRLQPTDRVVLMNVEYKDRDRVSVEKVLEYVEALVTHITPDGPAMRVLRQPIVVSKTSTSDKSEPATPTKNKAA